MKQRLSHISFLQTFGIILVVLGHSFYRVSPDNPFIRWIYGFHMPLFFFISGYLLHYTQPDLQSIRLFGTNGYLTRKARRLLLPYFVISSLLFVPKAMMSSYAVRPIDLSLNSYIDMLVYPYHNVLGAFWFLPTIFLVFTAFVFMARLSLKVHPRTYIRMVLLACIAVNICIKFHHESIFNILGVVHYLVYFVMGYIFEKYNYEATLNRFSPSVILIFTFAMSIILLDIPCFRSTELLTAINGILMSMALAALYKRCGCSFLDHLYGYTFTIYLYSGLFQILSLQVLLHFIPFPPYVYIPLAFLTGLYGPWCMDKWIRAGQQ